MKHVKTILKKLILIILVFVATGTVAQSMSSDVIVGSKRLAQRTIAVEPFSIVQIDGYKVYLVQDTLYEVRISGEDNIISEIAVISSDGVINAERTSSAKLKNKRPIEIFVHFIDIDILNAENAEYETIGSITTDSLQVTSSTTEFNLEVHTNVLRADLRGATFDRGTLEVTGTADTCDVFLDGKASFVAPKLTGDNFMIVFGPRTFYKIKRKNFKNSNVKSSTNSLQRMGNSLMNFFSFFW